MNANVTEMSTATFFVVDGTVHVILGCVPFGLLFLTSSHIEYRSNLLKVETHEHALAY